MSEIEQLESSGIYADLQEFAYEVAEAPGLVGICVELDTGESASLGQSLEELFGESEALTVREIFLSILHSGQDALSMVWSDLHLLVYRIGQRASLWVWCEGQAGENEVRDIWKKRRGPWSMRLDSQSPAPQASPANDSGIWVRTLGPRIRELLQSTEELFVALRTAQSAVSPDSARQEFASLAEEWASFCDPSVVSLPMLLDSLRQCLSPEGNARTEFFEQMQQLMAGPQT